MDAETLRMLGPWLSAIASGLAYAGLAIAVYLTFRVLDFPDLTVDGSLGLGAAVTAALISVRHFDPWLALLAAIAAGALAGLTTGLLHTRLGINGLLASILVAIGMFTINLRVMGSSNVSLFSSPSIFGTTGEQGTLLAALLAPFGALASRTDFRAGVLLLAITVLIVAAVHRWLSSEQGLALRATGDNPRMIRALGVNTERMKVLGLVIANGLTGLSGGVLAMQLGYADITLGPGAILVGLAAVILGEALLHGRGVLAGLAGAVIGAVVFQAAIAATLVQGWVQFEPTDQKLASALVVLVALLTPFVRSRLRPRRAG